MKLLHIIAQMDPRLGGVGEAVRNTVKKLNELGIENEIVSLDAPDAPFLQKEKVRIQALGPRKSQWCYSARLFSWLLLNAPIFDSIIIHGMWLYPGYAVRKALRQLSNEGFFKKNHRPKVFIMPHGMLDPYFQRAASRKLKALRNWLYWQLFERKIIRDANGLLFTCEEELFLARTTFSPYQPQKEVAVGLGLSMPPAVNNKMYKCFQEKNPGLNPNSPYILFLGRIHPKKGVDILIEAYFELLNNTLQTISNQQGLINTGECYIDEIIQSIKFPSLVIAGPGLESSYGRSLMNLVYKNTLLNRFVFFPGMLVDDAKWGAFYGCEAFILPSHQENFGIAVVEALACGKPVLISNKVNIWREIEAEGGGVIEKDTQEGVYSMLKKWLQLSVAHKQSMAYNAGIVYHKYFASKPAAEKFYNAVLTL